MARRDYFDDPTGPKANSIVVATNAFVTDDKGRVLLIQRSDNGLWSLPGGAQEIGETVAACAERETLEETGYEVKVTGLVGVYSDPRHVIAYDDGEIRQEFALVLFASLQGGARHISDESHEVAWVLPNLLHDHPMHEWIRTRVRDALEGRRLSVLA